MNHAPDDQHMDSGSGTEQPPEPRGPTAERQPTDLQRAVQQRAQESLERSRERARTKPAPIKWAVTFVLALIPVIVLVAGIDAFVRVFHQINDYYSKLPVPAPEPQEPAANEPIEQRPGIIILQSAPLEDAQPAEDAQPPAPSTSRRPSQSDQP
jgi:hypothetical protein